MANTLKPITDKTRALATNLKTLVCFDEVQANLSNSSTEIANGLDALQTDTTTTINNITANNKKDLQAMVDVATDEIINEVGKVNANAEVLGARNSKIFGEKNLLGERIDTLDGEFEHRAINIDWYSPNGNGIDDDSAIFEELENNFKGKTILLNGKTFKVSKRPFKNKYVDGFFFTTSKKDSGYTIVQNTNTSNVVIGRNSALNAIPNKENSDIYHVISIGPESAQNIGDSANEIIAIGASALLNLKNGASIGAIGKGALLNLEGTLETDGTRLFSIGDNSMRFSKKSKRSVAFGRNALQTNEDADECVAIGYNCMSGLAPISIGGTIVNTTPNVSIKNTGIGSNSLQMVSGSYNTSFGACSAQYLKNSARNVSVGAECLQNLERYKNFKGLEIIVVDVSGDYSIYQNQITLEITNANLVIGGYILAKIGTHEQQYFQIETVLINKITLVNSENLKDESGKFNIYEIVTKKVVETHDDNVCIGVATGKNSGGSKNVIIGNYGMYLNTGSECFGLGHEVMRYTTSGNGLSRANNSGALGAGAGVSGDNQVQIGNSRQTPYAYQAMQLRSDERDKTDITETVLGLDFIKLLKPVDYKFDFREDYVVKKNGKIERLTKDGSKKRSRTHHGLIAQDLQTIIEETGIDFGGFQNHALNGGEDILSIGYEELIAPMIKAIQELSKRIEELEK